MSAWLRMTKNIISVTDLVKNVKDEVLQKWITDNGKNYINPSDVKNRINIESNEKSRRKYAETIYSAVVRSNNFPKILSEAYHKAKADGSNPELVKAVEDLLAPKVAPTTNTEGETQTTEAQLQEFGVPEQDVR